MDNLQNGIAAFKAGKRDEARKLFIAAMKETPNDENVWGCLYQVSNNDNERIQALKKVVAINPQNGKAKELLDKLLAPPPEQSPPQTPAPAQKIETKKPDPIQQINTLIGIGSIVLVCFICICAFTMYEPPAGPKDYKTMSLIMCELYVENMLKSPSTADFPSSSSSNIRDLGNNIFEVNSYVDAQNSFGAVIRTNWYCKIQYIGTVEDEEGDPKFWNLLDIKLYE